MKFCHGNTAPLHIEKSASSVHQHTRLLKYSLCCELCTFSLQNTLSLRDYLIRLFSYVWLICRCHSTMLYEFVILNNVVVNGKYLKGSVIKLNQRMYCLNILNWVKYSLISRKQSPFLSMQVISFQPNIPNPIYPILQLDSDEKKTSYT